MFCVHKVSTEYIFLISSLDKATHTHTHSHTEYGKPERGLNFIGKMGDTLILSIMGDPGRRESGN